MAWASLDFHSVTLLDVHGTVGVDLDDLARVPATLLVEIARQGGVHQGAGLEQLC